MCNPEKEEREKNKSKEREIETRKEETGCTSKREVEKGRVNRRVKKKSKAASPSLKGIGRIKGLFSQKVEIGSESLAGRRW